MNISFPGGMAVEAVEKGFRIRTDQAVADGGSGSAPTPFDLFLASIGTCAGFYALRFFQERKLPTAGLGLTLTAERDAEKRRVSRIRIDIELPSDFPEKYHAAILRAVDQCGVKRHIVQPPGFDVEVMTPVLMG
jgi:putative redox protein